LEEQGKYKNRNFGYISSEEGLGIIFGRPTALIGFSYHFYTKVQSEGMEARQICEKITELEVNESPFPSGMLVPKNSPYREYLNYRKANKLLHFT
jgi:hypothetical protein